MNDKFIYEVIPHSRTKRAGLRVAKGVKNITIGEASFVGVDNAMVFEGDADNFNVEVMRVENGVTPFYMNDFIDSSVGELIVEGSPVLSKAIKEYDFNIQNVTSERIKAELMVNHSMLLKTHLIFDEAFIITRDALDIFKKEKEKAGISICYGNLGILYKSLGKLDEALLCYELALEIDLEQNRIEGVIANYQNLAIGYCLKNNNKAAINIYNKSMNLAKKHFPEKLSQIYSNLAISLEKEDRNSEALSFYERAVSLNIENNNLYLLAFDHRSLGRLYYALGNIKKATEMYNESLSIFHQIGIFREEHHVKCEMFNKKIIQVVTSSL